MAKPASALPPGELISTVIGFLGSRCSIARQRTVLSLSMRSVTGPLISSVRASSRLRSR
jgi:hypothetical protein